MSYIRNYSSDFDYTPRRDVGRRYMIAPPRLRGAAGLIFLALISASIGLLGIAAIADQIRHGISFPGSAKPMFLGLCVVAVGFSACFGLSVLAARYTRNAWAFKLAKAQAYFGRNY